MTTRFAGDFFGIPLTSAEQNSRSSLIDYFPELKSVKQTASRPATSLGPARSFGNATAVTPFVGFKTFETTNERKAAPVFTGFKTFEQPKSRDTGTQVPSPYATAPTDTKTKVDPEVLKTLGLV